MKTRNTSGRLCATLLCVWLLPAMALVACSKKSPGPGPGNTAEVSQIGGGLTADLDAWEQRDLSVPPQATLHAGAAHGATPNQIPGGKIITTRALLELQRSAGQKLVLLDVLGAPQTLPNSFRAVPAAAPGDFKDATQQQFVQVLKQLTQGDNNTPIVTYCANPECWMSYNAALRAINAGYTNVQWYRGGLEAWQRAGQPFSGGQPNSGGQPPQVAPQQPNNPGSGAFPQQPSGPAQPNNPPQSGGTDQPNYPAQHPGYPQQPNYPPSDAQQPGAYGGQPQNGPPQNYPQPGYPQQDYPQQGYPQQDYPQTGNPQQGYPQQNYPQQGAPPVPQN